jgi:hypothetical protein
MRTNASTTAVIAAALAGVCLLGSAPARAADACATLSQAQVSALLGAPVKPGEPIGTLLCIWQAQDTKDQRNVHLSFLSEPMFEAAKKPNPLTPKTSESGLGDEAVFIHPKGMIFNLIVRKGGTRFRVQARSNPSFGGSYSPEMDAKDQELDRAFARAVLKTL